jgi:hypothetical protein
MRRNSGVHGIGSSPRRLRQVERERALEQASGVRIVGRSPALARVLDTQRLQINRATLNDKLKKYGLTKE